jgi:hypothetical protein
MDMSYWGEERGEAASIEELASQEQGSDELNFD